MGSRSVVAASLIGVTCALAISGSVALAKPLAPGKGEWLVRAFVRLLGDAGPDAERARLYLTKLGFEQDPDGPLVGYSGGVLVTVEHNWMLMTLELEAWGDEIAVLRDAVSARFSNIVETAQTERNRVDFEIVTEQGRLVVNVLVTEKQGDKLLGIAAMAFPD